MKKLIIFALIFSILYGCSIKKEVEKEDVYPDILLESIATRFPGELFYSKGKLAMIDPFGKPSFIKIFDSNNGELLGTAGVIGQGPLEFITPSGVHFIENEFLVYDPNLRSLGYFDIGKINEVGSDAIDNIQKNDLFDGMLRLLSVDNTRFIGANYDDNPFTILDFSNRGKIEFGKFPLSDKVINAKDVFQGTIKFNKDLNFFVYASFYTKYLSFYSFDKNVKKPTLIWESNLIEPKYRIIDNQLEWEKDQEKGFSDLCFTKDFVIVSFKEGLSITKKGRGTDLIPESLYVFDYDGNLVKHLVSSVPILRLSDNLESNIVFAIGVTPEFCLMKFNLNNL